MMTLMAEEAWLYDGAITANHTIKITCIHHGMTSILETAIFICWRSNMMEFLVSSCLKETSTCTENPSHSVSTCQDQQQYSPHCCCPPSHLDGPSHQQPWTDRRPLLPRFFRRVSSSIKHSMTRMVASISPSLIMERNTSVLPLTISFATALSTFRLSMYARKGLN